MLPFFLSPFTAALSAATTAVVAVVAAGILLLFFIWLLLGRRAAANRDTNEYPYEPRPLLTPNEERFYQALLPLAARYELHLLAKVGWKKTITGAISAKSRPSMWISCWLTRKCWNRCC